MPVVANSLFSLERLIYGIGHHYALEPIAAASIRETLPGTEQVDLVIDLTGDADPSTETPLLALTCNGVAPELGAVNAVLTGTSAVLALDLMERGACRPVSRWPAAFEDHRVVARAVDNILGRGVQALVRAVRARNALPDLDPEPTLPEVWNQSVPVTSARMLPFVLATLRTKVTDRISRLARQGPTWLTGWRPSTDDDVVPSLDGRSYARLVDDGKRFYADPFLLSREGRHFLFVEEFPFATSRGLISVAELVDGKLLGSPRPVLETDCHLSYPFVLEHEGETYMIPETSARRSVELWRAVSFPDVWELDRVLIRDEILADATVVQRDGTWFLLAAQSQHWTSSWDALAVWHAPSLFGPWTPLEHNPVVVDVATARPAGAMFASQGRLIRPAQNCSRAYGSGLVFATVDLLSRTGFRQSVVQSVDPVAPLSGMHTYNRTAGLEVVDVFGRVVGDSFVL